MYATCIRYVGSEVDATEVLSNVFIKVFDKLKQFNAEGSLEGWIRTIAVRESLNYIKQRKRYVLEESWEQSAHDIPDEEFLSNLDADEILGMIQALPEGYRTVFNLYAIEGYGHKEIAETLNISESTSKTQLFKARAKLKEQIKLIEERHSHEK